MKNKISLLQLDDILPMAEHGIWIRINGQANYISHNDIWDLILKKYGHWIVDNIDAEGPLNDGGNPHVEISIAEYYEEKEESKEKPEEHRLTQDDLVMPNMNNHRWFSWEVTTTEEKKDGV